MRNSIYLYKDGDTFGMRVYATDDTDLINKFSEAMAAMIQKKVYDWDWEFQLSGWIHVLVHGLDVLHESRERSKAQYGHTIGGRCPLEVVSGACFLNECYVYDLEKHEIYRQDSIVTKVEEEKEVGEPDVNSRGG